MQRAPGRRPSTSSRAVCAFMQTMRSTSFLRAIQPSLFARIVNQVGSPAMFDGNMFLPETGTPIWKIERIRTVLAVWLPEPLTVATWMLNSLTAAWPRATGRAWAGDSIVVDMNVASPFGGSYQPPANHFFFSFGKAQSRSPAG